MSTSTTDIETFEIILTRRMAMVEATLCAKGKEYSTSEDRLINFKVAGALQGISAEKALLGFVAKHIVALYKFVNQPAGEVTDAQWEEKIGDIIVYMVLLEALLAERQRN